MAKKFSQDDWNGMMLQFGTIDPDLFYQVFNTLPVSLFITDLDHRILFVNQYFLNQLPAGDYIGKHCSVFKHPICDTPNCTYCQFENGSTENYFQMDRKTYRTNISSLKGSDGQIIGFIEYITEVMPNDEAQQTLQSIAEGCPGGLFRCTEDPDLTLVFGNETFNLLHGFNDHPHKRRCIRDDMFPSDYRQCWSIITRAVNNRQSTVNFQYQMKDSSGQIHWMSCGCGIDYSGIVPILNGIEVDITPLKNLEQKWRVSEQVLTLVFKQAGSCLFDYDIQKGQIAQSDVAMDHFGTTKRSLLLPNGDSSPDIIHTNSSDAYRVLLQRIKSGELDVSETLLMRVADGTYRWHNLQFRVIFNNSGLPARALGLCTDISDWYTPQD